MSSIRRAVAAQLESLTGPGGPAGTDSARSTVQLYAADPNRILLHKDLVDSYSADGSSQPVLTGGHAIITAGPPGAGKSTALAAVRPAGFRDIDADLIKDDLLRQAVADGIYADLFSQVLADGKPIAPRELAALVHRESTRISDDLLSRCLARQENIVIHGTLSWPDLATRYVSDLAANGYRTIEVVNLLVPHKVCVERAEQRWWAGRTGGDVLGGRFTPRAAIDSKFGASDICTDVAEALYGRAAVHASFDRVLLRTFDVNGDEVDCKSYPE